MGSLIYSTSVTRTDIDDRALAHLRIVILSKLRRREGLAFSWKVPPNEGSGHTTIWLSPEIPLTFRFATNEQADINRQWVEDLLVVANTASGLVLLPEPPLAPLH